MRARPWPVALCLAWIACSGPDLAPLPEVALAELGSSLAGQLAPQLDALGVDPRNVQAAGKAGMLLQAYDQHGLAEAFLERAGSLDSSDHRWPYYRGISLGRLGRGPEAAEAFREALRRDDAYRPAKQRLADALLASDAVQESRQVYLDLVESDSDDARALHGLGRAEAAAGRPQAAVEHLLRATQLTPEYGQAHYALAQAYRELGEEARAAQHLELFSRHGQSEPATEDPLASEVSVLRVTAAEFLKRGVEAKDAGRSADAIALHLQALQEDPALTQAHVNLVILYGSAGRLDDAAGQYRSALDAAEPSAELHYNYGVVAFRGGDIPAARAAFEAALDINPDHALANHNLGQLLHEQGRFAEARAHYQRTLASRPDHALSHYKLGLLWARERNAAKAVQAFEAASRERSERTPTYLFSLAGALLASGQRDRALRRFRGARAEAERYSQPELVAQIDEALRRIGAAGR